MNKYHITKKHYIAKIFQCLFISFVIFVFLLEFLTEFILVNHKLTAEIISFVALILILVSSLIITWLGVKRHIFYDDNKNFVVQKGVLIKFVRNIPYENITTIKLKRNLWDYLIGTTKLQIETGAVLAIESEAKLVLNKAYAYQLKYFLENKNKNQNLELPNPSFLSDFKQEENKEYLYKAKKRSLLLGGLLNEGLLLSILMLVFIFFTGFEINRYNVANDPLNQIEEPLLIIPMVLIVITFITIVFMISNLMMYFGFKLKVEDDVIEYEYGLFSKTNIKTNVSKINSVTIKQSLLMKVFKKYALYISVIGVGAKNDQENQNDFESNYLLPIANKKQVDEVLKKIGYEELTVDDFEYKKPIRFKKLRFIFIPLFFITLLFVSFILFSNIDLLKYYFILVELIIIYLLIVISLILKMKNHGYYFNNNLIIKDGSFTTRKVLIKRSRIQILTFKQGPIDLLLNVGNIHIKYKKLMDMRNIKCFTENDFNEIKKQVF